MLVEQKLTKRGSQRYLDQEDILTIVYPPLLTKQFPFWFQVAFWLPMWFSGYHIGVFVSLCKFKVESLIPHCIIFSPCYLKWDTILMGFPLHVTIVYGYGKLFLDAVVVFQLLHDIHYCVILPLEAVAEHCSHKIAESGGVWSPLYCTFPLK